ncbi:MAG: PD40 domain-containing protein, partial [Synergistaceae bacterium]|nr:PD40 domain-containing protein [Synergistaceae bacterium]
MRILFVLFALLLAMPSACAFAAVPPILPMEDFFRNPENSAFSISPDGKWLAFARPWQHRMNVYVREISTGTEKRITSATERDISGFFWKGNGRIVFAQDSGGDENFHVYITDIMGGEARDLTPFDKVKAGVLDDLEDDPVHMLIDMNRENPEVFDVYRCNIETGELELVGRNPGNITGWLTDHDGKLRCAFQTDGV